MKTSAETGVQLIIAVCDRETWRWLSRKSDNPTIAGEDAVRCAFDSLGYQYAWILNLSPSSELPTYSKEFYKDKIVESTMERKW